MIEIFAISIYYPLILALSVHVAGKKINYLAILIIVVAILSCILMLALESHSLFMNSEDFRINVAMIQDNDSPGKYIGYEIIKFVVPYLGGVNSLIALWVVTFGMYILYYLLIARRLMMAIQISAASRVATNFLFIAFISIRSTDGFFGYILNSQGIIGTAHLLFQSVSLCIFLIGLYFLSSNRGVLSGVIFIISVLFHYSALIYLVLLIIYYSVFNTNSPASFGKRVGAKKAFVVIIGVAIVAALFGRVFADAYVYLMSMSGIFIDIDAIQETDIDYSGKSSKFSIFYAVCLMAFVPFRHRIYKSFDNLGVKLLDLSNAKFTIAATESIIFIAGSTCIFALVLGPIVPELAYRISFIIYIYSPILSLIFLLGLWSALLSIKSKKSRSVFR